ncbi:uncharacterized protein LOC126369502 isoform X1 [Pectinophora gossypiella]|nr:uncharacterized protein LOC126369502 isoform X1 [Pectinophora gossypiella]
MLETTKLLYFLFLIVFLSECQGKNYCGLNVCNNTKEHTLCKFQSEDPARHCVGFEKTIKTQREKQAILDKLNSRRNKVAAGEIRSFPSAENIMKLEWSDELELSAQRWANQCVKHSTPDIRDTCRDLGNVFVGQNIATIYGEAPGLTPLALVDVWYMELLNANASVISSYQRSSDAGYSHYEYFTQLIWAKSKQVGCGGVKFKENVQGKEKKRDVYRLVCNFAPGGNLLNQSVYDDGKMCSKCPEGTCDSVFTALCSLKSQSTKYTKSGITEHESATSTNEVTNWISKGLNTNSKTNINSTVIDSHNSGTLGNDNIDILIPFDYVPHEYIRPTILTTTKTTPSCKDVMVVDDFVELLKKKLSTDPMFKEFLKTTTVSTEHFENAYTDAFALVNRIYSSNEKLSTTNKPQERDSVNSTLLVDLVEAVIFRNNDKIKSTREPILGTRFEPDVSPVKIQAELAEVRLNSDFTGHLFFPEDIENGNIDTTEVYYDMPSVSLDDFTIGAIKRTKATKDFLEEILESESTTEKQESSNEITRERLLNKNLKKKYEFNRRKRGDNFQTDYNSGKDTDYIVDHIAPLENFKKSLRSDCSYHKIKYVDLLDKIASDLKVLKLNKRFHCTRNISQKNSFMVILIFLVILQIIF